MNRMSTLTTAAREYSVSITAIEDRLWGKDRNAIRQNAVKIVGLTHEQEEAVLQEFCDIPCCRPSQC